MSGSPSLSEISLHRGQLRSLQNVPMRLYHKSDFVCWWCLAQVGLILFRSHVLFFLTAEQRNTFLGRVSFTLKSLIHQLCIFYLQTKKIAPVNLLLLDLANPSKKSYACTCLWNTCLKKLVNPDHLTTRVTVCWWCQAQVGLILFRSHVLFFLTAEQRNTFLSWVSFPVKSLTHPLCIFYLQTK